MKNLIKDEIFKVLKRDFILEKPKDRNLAHYATPLAFSLAKELRKSPVAIANELVSEFKDNLYFEASSLNGYLNFKLKPKFLDLMASKILENPLNFAANSEKKESIFIEYVSANPTGPLHIGHVRGAIYGDSLARVGRHLGYEIHTEYYVNDAGSQIDLLGISLSLRARELLFNENVEYPEKYYRGEYIDDLAKKFLDLYGREIFDDLPRLSLLAKDEILEQIKGDLASVGITIDTYESERALYGELEPTINRLKNQGGIYDKDGATYINSTKRGDDSDRVVVRTDGRPTYLAGDIIYHNVKFAKNFDRYINIWGADHHGYINRIKASIHYLGYDDSKLEVILMQMVSLLKDGQPFKMSKRAGTSILMSDVVSVLGSDALRFMFASKRADTHLEIDIDEIKKQDSSNPIFYINYAHARVYQVFKKVGKKFDDVKNANLASLDENGKNLLFECLILPEILEDAFESRNLHKIADYLKGLSASFHKFYNENRVLGSQNESDLLKLFAVVASTIKLCLGLLGVEAKEKMEE